MKTFTTAQVDEILNITESIVAAEQQLASFVDAGIDLAKASVRKTCRTFTNEIAALESKKAALLAA